MNDHRVLCFTRSDVEALMAEFEVDEEAMDELLAADDRSGQLDASVDSGRLYAEYRRLAAEQAALRRVAALVARGVASPVIFGAVAEEMRR